MENEINNERSLHSEMLLETSDAQDKRKVNRKRKRLC